MAARDERGAAEEQYDEGTDARIGVSEEGGRGRESSTYNFCPLLYSKWVGMCGSERGYADFEICLGATKEEQGRWGE